MAEREIVVDKLRLTYEGLFDLRELFKLIEAFFENRNYDKREGKNIEVVKPDGKYLEIEIAPWRSVTDYYKYIIPIRFVGQNIRKVDIEKDGQKISINQGRIQLVFDAIVETDHQARWESKPEFFFLRTIFDKYIYRPYSLGYHGVVKSDLMALHSQIKAFLNMYRN